MNLTTLLLTQREIRRLVDLPTAIRVVRQAFASMARGQAVMPPKVYLPLPHRSDLRAMPAYLARPSACGIKWVNVHPRNPRWGLPTVMALIVMNDVRTGAPLAVLDGSLVTKLRTAASAAVASRLLARPGSKTLGLVGCGGQAESHCLALAHVLPLRTVRVWGRGRREASAFCRRMARRLPQVSFRPASSVRGCVADADCVVTITPSRRPLVHRGWLRPGTHLNAMGADAPGKQELDPAILRAAKVVVDDRAQAIHGGELNMAIRRHQFHPSQIYASLGELVIGCKAGRRSREELTVFDSTGLAVHDIALGAEIVRRARRRGVGRTVRFC